MFSINPQVSWLTLFFVGSIHRFVGELSDFFASSISILRMVKSKIKPFADNDLASFLHLSLTYLSYISDFVVYVNSHFLGRNIDEFCGSLIGCCLQKAATQGGTMNR